MIKIENVEITGWKPAIRGMRNPMNSWNKSDSAMCREDSDDCTVEPALGCPKGEFDADWFCVGSNDYRLMTSLSESGTDHRKFMRMLVVYMDVLAPIYWWKEFDTYKVGTVANSCSTMHKIHAKKFEIDDFSHEHMTKQALRRLKDTIITMNDLRAEYQLFNDKMHWYSMIQLLPSSYNQKRTLQLNYEVLANIYAARRHHKLKEWHDFCDWIESLPYSEIIMKAR